MGKVRFVIVGPLLVPLVLGCNEDNTFGLGNSDIDRYSASLSGAGVRPVPVATTATATAELSIRDTDVGTAIRTIGYTLTASNLPSATAAHVHLGGASIANGPILLTLFTNTADTALTSSQIATGIVPESGIGGGVGLDSLAKLMRVGAAYVDVHTTANPLGLIRGQLVGSGQQAPGDLFVARSLSGGKERPTPVVSSATGSATFELLSGGSVRYHVSVAGLTGARMAHIHTGVADSAGPIAVTLFTAATPTGPLTGTLASGTFTAANIQLPGVGLDSLLRLMRVGRTYVNVHTELNPGGEIRAQIEPVSVLP
jgi:CHRD domain